MDETTIGMIFFEKLRSYLIKNMRMSHVYQPVMIKHLLENSGRAKAEEIAIDLVQNDLSQVEYYTERVNSMVGKVLRNIERDGSTGVRGTASGPCRGPAAARFAAVQLR